MWCSSSPGLDATQFSDWSMHSMACCATSLPISSFYALFGCPFGCPYWRALYSLDWNIISLRKLKWARIQIHLFSGFLWFVAASICPCNCFLLPWLSLFCLNAIWGVFLLALLPWQGLFLPWLSCKWLKTSTWRGSLVFPDCRSLPSHAAQSWWCWRVFLHYRGSCSRMTTWRHSQNKWEV